MSTENKTQIKIGTSGYSFLDWVGPFYPPGIQRGKMLDYYIQHFNVVEINSSYYNIPHPKIFENMIKKVPPGFEFFVKAHKSLTHERENILTQTAKFVEAIQPLRDAKMLSGVLLQFPFSFKYSQKNLTYLKRARELLPNCNVIVEFRQRGWVREDVFDMLKRNDMAYCCVDEPPLENLVDPDAIATTDMGYIRFHGRNRKDWWSGGAERYNYLYDENQLQEWSKKINGIKRITNNIYMFFNNCHHGQAVKNAKMMADILQVNIGVAK